MPKLLPCPSCNYARSWVIRRYHRKCKQCRKEWSPRTFHPVLPFRLSRREWLRLIEVFLRDHTILAVTNECHLAYRTAQAAILRIRRKMATVKLEPFCLVVEADGTYIGGAWKNKPAWIRRRYRVKRGRGTNKQAIFGLMQRYPPQVKAWLVKNEKAVTTIPLINSQVRKGSLIFTDGHKGYRRLPKYGYHHDWVDHEKGEYVKGIVHTQTLDGYWGLLKNRLDRTGGVRRSFIHLYLAEHQWRYNHHHLSRKQQAKLIYQLLTD
ncbi:MAG: IS1595 family transposase [Candidatus Kerfeldbacteria bacterium]|nr:IS1595 family transposase [Candidatus Kerfeldbacteria bacterium]